MQKKKSSHPTLQVFANRISGPELKIEKLVYKSIFSIISPNTGEIWTGASVPVGAGKPDLLITHFQPELLSLNKLTRNYIGLISYLRAYGKATPEKISKDLSLSAQTVRKSVLEMEESGIVRKVKLNYSLVPQWKSILTDITSIEVKVSNWRKAFEQATRNTLFSHLSYVALPEKVALKANEVAAVKKSGVGIIAVKDDGFVSVLRNSKRHKPKVWFYYYKIADIIAKRKQE